MEWTALSLPKRPYTDKIPVPPPEGNLPEGELPIWQRLPMDAKIPLPWCPPKTVTFARSVIGESVVRTYPSKQFEHKDIYLRHFPKEYNSLNDPYLRDYFRAAQHYCRMLHKDFITKDGKVKCTLPEFNQYRMYLHKLYALEVSQLRRLQILAEKQRLAGKLPPHPVHQCSPEDRHELATHLLERDLKKTPKVGGTKEIICPEELKVLTGDQEENFPGDSENMEWISYQRKLRNDYKERYEMIRDWLNQESNYLRNIARIELASRERIEVKRMKRFHRLCENGWQFVAAERKIREAADKERKANQEKRHREVQKRWEADNHDGESGGDEMFKSSWDLESSVRSLTSDFEDKDTVTAESDASDTGESRRRSSDRDETKEQIRKKKQRAPEEYPKGKKKRLHFAKDSFSRSEDQASKKIRTDDFTSSVTIDIPGLSWSDTDLSPTLEELSKLTLEDSGTLVGMEPSDTTSPSKAEDMEYSSLEEGSGLVTSAEEEASMEYMSDSHLDQPLHSTLLPDKVAKDLRAKGEESSSDVLSEDSDLMSTSDDLEMYMQDISAVQEILSSEISLEELQEKIEAEIRMRTARSRVTSEEKGFGPNASDHGSLVQTSVISQSPEEEWADTYVMEATTGTEIIISQPQQDLTDLKLREETIEDIPETATAEPSEETKGSWLESLDGSTLEDFRQIEEDSHERDTSVTPQLPEQPVLHDSERKKTSGADESLSHLEKAHITDLVDAYGTETIQGETEAAEIRFCESSEALRKAEDTVNDILDIIDGRTAAVDDTVSVKIRSKSDVSEEEIDHLPVPELESEEVVTEKDEDIERTVEVSVDVGYEGTSLAKEKTSEEQEEEERNLLSVTGAIDDLISEIDEAQRSLKAEDDIFARDITLDRVKVETEPEPSESQIEYESGPEPEQELLLSERDRDRYAIQTEFIVTTQASEDEDEPTVIETKHDKRLKERLLPDLKSSVVPLMLDRVEDDTDRIAEDRSFSVENTSSRVGLLSKPEDAEVKQHLSVQKSDEGRISDAASVATFICPLPSFEQLSDLSDVPKEMLPETDRQTEAIYKSQKEIDHKEILYPTGKPSLKRKFDRIGADISGGTKSFSEITYDKDPSAKRIPFRISFVDDNVNFVSSVPSYTSLLKSMDDTMSEDYISTFLSQPVKSFDDATQDFGEESKRESVEAVTYDADIKREKDIVIEFTHAEVPEKRFRSDEGTTQEAFSSQKEKGSSVMKFSPSPSYEDLLDSTKDEISESSFEVDLSSQLTEPDGQETEGIYAEYTMEETTPPVFEEGHRGRVKSEMLLDNNHIHQAEPVSDDLLFTSSTPSFTDISDFRKNLVEQYELKTVLPTQAQKDYAEEDYFLEDYDYAVKQNEYEKDSDSGVTEESDSKTDAVLHLAEKSGEEVSSRTSLLRGSAQYGKSEEQDNIGQRFLDELSFISFVPSYKKASDQSSQLLLQNYMGVHLPSHLTSPPDVYEDEDGDRLADKILGEATKKKMVAPKPLDTDARFLYALPNYTKLSVHGKKVVSESGLQTDLPRHLFEFIKAEEEEYAGTEIIEGTAKYRTSPTYSPKVRKDVEKDEVDRDGDERFQLVGNIDSDETRKSSDRRPTSINGKRRPEALSGESSVSLAASDASQKEAAERLENMRQILGEIEREKLTLQAEAGSDEKRKFDLDYNKRREQIKTLIKFHTNELANLLNESAQLVAERSGESDGRPQSGQELVSAGSTASLMTAEQELRDAMDRYFNEIGAESFTDQSQEEFSQFFGAYQEELIRLRSKISIPSTDEETSKESLSTKRFQKPVSESDVISGGEKDSDESFSDIGTADYDSTLSTLSGTISGTSYDFSEQNAEPSEKLKKLDQFYEDEIKRSAGVLVTSAKLYMPTRNLSKPAILSFDTEQLDVEAGSAESMSSQEERPAKDLLEYLDRKYRRNNLELSSLKNQFRKFPGKVKLTKMEMVSKDHDDHFASAPHSGSDEEDKYSDTWLEYLARKHKFRNLGLYSFGDELERASILGKYKITKREIDEDDYATTGTFTDEDDQKSEVFVHSIAKKYPVKDLELYSVGSKFKRALKKQERESDDERCEADYEESSFASTEKSPISALGKFSKEEWAHLLGSDRKDSIAGLDIERFRHFMSETIAQHQKYLKNVIYNSKYQIPDRHVIELNGVQTEADREILEKSLDAGIEKPVGGENICFIYSIPQRESTCPDAAKSLSYPFYLNFEMILQNARMMSRKDTKGPETDTELPAFVQPQVSSTGRQAKDIVPPPHRSILSKQQEVIRDMFGLGAEREIMRLPELNFIYSSPEYDKESFVKLQTIMTSESEILAKLIQDIQAKNKRLRTWEDLFAAGRIRDSIIIVKQKLKDQRDAKLLKEVERVKEEPRKYTYALPQDIKAKRSLYADIEEPLRRVDICFMFAEPQYESKLSDAAKSLCYQNLEIILDRARVKTEKDTKVPEEDIGLDKFIQSQTSIEKRKVQEGGASSRLRMLSEQRSRTSTWDMLPLDTGMTRSPELCFIYSTPQYDKESLVKLKEIMTSESEVTAKLTQDAQMHYEQAGDTYAGAWEDLFSDREMREPVAKEFILGERATKNTPHRDLLKDKEETAAIFVEKVPVLSRVSGRRIPSAATADEQATLKKQIYEYLRKHTDSQDEICTISELSFLYSVPVYPKTDSEKMVGVMTCDSESFREVYRSLSQKHREGSGGELLPEVEIKMFPMEFRQRMSHVLKHQLVYIPTDDDDIKSEDIRFIYSNPVYSKDDFNKLRSITIYDSEAFQMLFEDRQIRKAEAEQKLPRIHFVTCQDDKADFGLVDGKPSSEVTPFYPLRKNVSSSTEEDYEDDTLYGSAADLRVLEELAFTYSTPSHPKESKECFQKIEGIKTFNSSTFQKYFAESQHTADQRKADVACIQPEEIPGDKKFSYQFEEIPDDEITDKKLSYQIDSESAMTGGELGFIYSAPEHDKLSFTEEKDVMSSDQKSLLNFTKAFQIQTHSILDETEEALSLFPDLNELQYEEKTLVEEDKSEMLPVAAEKRVILDTPTVVAQQTQQDFISVGAGPALPPEGKEKDLSVQSERSVAVRRHDVWSSEGDASKETLVDERDGKAFLPYWKGLQHLSRSSGKFSQFDEEKQPLVTFKSEIHKSITVSNLGSIIGNLNFLYSTTTYKDVGIKNTDGTLESDSEVLQDSHKGLLEATQKFEIKMEYTSPVLEEKPLTTVSFKTVVPLQEKYERTVRTAAYDIVQPTLMEVNSGDLCFIYSIPMLRYLHEEKIKYTIEEPEAFEVFCKDFTFKVDRFEPDEMESGIHKHIEQQSGFVEMPDSEREKAPVIERTSHLERDTLSEKDEMRPGFRISADMIDEAPQTSGKGEIWRVEKKMPPADSTDSRRLYRRSERGEHKTFIKEERVELGIGAVEKGTPIWKEGKIPVDYGISPRKYSFYESEMPLHSGEIGFIYSIPTLRTKEMDKMKSIMTSNSDTLESVITQLRITPHAFPKKTDESFSLKHLEYQQKFTPVGRREKPTRETEEMVLPVRKQVVPPREVTAAVTEGKVVAQKLQRQISLPLPPAKMEETRQKRAPHSFSKAEGLTSEIALSFIYSSPVFITAYDEKVKRFLPFDPESFQKLINSLEAQTRRDSAKKDTTPFIEASRPAMLERAAKSEDRRSLDKKLEHFARRMFRPDQASPEIAITDYEEGIIKEESVSTFKCEYEGILTVSRARQDSLDGGTLFSERLVKEKYLFPLEHKYAYGTDQTAEDASVFQYEKEGLLTVASVRPDTTGESTLATDSLVREEDLLFGGSRGPQEDVSKFRYEKEGLVQVTSARPDRMGESTLLVDRLVQETKLLSPDTEHAGTEQRQEKRKY